MYGAGQRLDQYGASVGEVVRNCPPLRDVVDELPAPAAAGVMAVTGLQAGGDVADGDAVTAVAATRSARGALLEPASNATQDGIEHDAGALRVAVRVIEELTHDLVPGNERHGHER